jgi:hypothetical protein
MILIGMTSIVVKGVIAAGGFGAVFEIAGEHGRLNLFKYLQFIPAIIYPMIQKAHTYSMTNILYFQFYIRSIHETQRV